LFCYNLEFQTISNYPLDRIIEIEELSGDFTPSDINWMDYFDDIIGVTKPEGQIVEIIILKFSEKRINYVLTKPLHSTQKLDRSDIEGKTITIEVIPNLELYQMLLSFGEDVEVISPIGVRDEIVRKINEMKNNY
jgi:predicted DNA-binding transcriptional regulator YafY